MNKNESPGSQSNARPSPWRQVTVVYEFCIIIMAWLFLFSHQHSATSEYVEATTRIAQVAGGLIVLCFIFRTRSTKAARIRTFIYGGTAVMMMPILISVLPDVLHGDQLVTPSIVRSAMVIVFLCCLILALCTLIAVGRRTNDTKVRQGTH